MHPLGYQKDIMACMHYGATEGNTSISSQNLCIVCVVRRSLWTCLIARLDA